MRVTWALGLALTIVLLGGCGTSTVPVSTQPRDEDTAQDLAGTIADMGRCDTVEHVQNKPGSWMFICDRLHGGDLNQLESFQIVTYANAATKQAAIARLNAAGFRYKEGPFFVVIAAKSEGPSPPPWRVLDGFPGSSPAHHP